MDKKMHKLASDTTAFAISRFASRAITFLLLPLYTSVLSTAEYGVSDAILTTINLLSPILTLCISESILRMTFEIDYKRNELFWSATVFLLIGTILLCSCTVFANNLNISFRDYWWDFVIIYALYNFDQNISYFARALNKVRVIAIVGVIQTVVIVSCNILFLLILKTGLYGYFLSTIFGYIVAIIFNIVLGRLYKYFFPLKVNISLVKKMLIYSVPLVITSIAWWINTSADKYMIEYFLGVDQRGIYAVAYKIPLIMTTITTIFTDSWRLTAYEDNSDEFPTFFSSVLNKLFGVCTLICSVLVISSEGLAKILFAKDFFVAWTCVPFLLMAFVFSTLSGYLASLFTKNKLTAKMSISTVVGCLVNISLNTILIPIFGTNAAGFTTFVAFFVTWMIRLTQSKRIIKMDIKNVNFILETAALFVMALAMMLNVSFRYEISGICLIIILIMEKHNIRDICLLVNTFLYKHSTHRKK